MFCPALTKTYLKRINFEGPIDNSVNCLNNLHLAHLKSLPFENLDIALNKPFNLGLEELLDKLLNQHRGGFCFELNYAFSLLLSTLGFEVKLLAARVFDQGQLGKEFDHLLLLVTIEQQAYIADVGFGDSFRQVLALDSQASKQLDAIFKLTQDAGFYSLMRQKKDAKWSQEYIFDLTPYQISDFYEMCDYHQTSAESGFTKRSVCTIATEDGRVTISDGRLIISSTSGKTKVDIKQQVQYRRLLLSHFGIRLAPNIDLGCLLVDKPAS